MALSNGHDEFNQWWATEGDWVEEPNQRRNGMSGVQRIERDGKVLYVKRIDPAPVPLRALPVWPPDHRARNRGELKIWNARA